MSEAYDNIKPILEAAIFAAGEPLTADKLTQLFPEEARPAAKEIKAALVELAESYHDRGVELVEVGRGYRFQAKADYAEFMQRLWEKKPPRYSRALLETLALIVYRQPITRGEIEDVRGVAVSSNIIKILSEREWVKVVGHKDVPGKPALYGTTSEFLDYFNLKSLGEMPPLQELVNLEELEAKIGEKLGEQLALDVNGKQKAALNDKANDEITVATDDATAETASAETNSEVSSHDTAANEAAPAEFTDEEDSANEVAPQPEVTPDNSAEEPLNQTPSAHMAHQPEHHSEDDQPQDDVELEPALTTA